MDRHLVKAFAAFLGLVWLWGAMPAVSWATEARVFIVYFAEDGSLPKGTEDVVRAAVDYHEALCAEDTFELAAGTDTIGSPQDSLERSRGYAAKVRALLMKRGVPWNKIAVMAAGDTELAVATADEVDEWRNRRVEITYSRADGPSGCLENIH